MATSNDDFGKAFGTAVGAQQPSTQISPSDVGKGIIQASKHFERQPWWKSVVDVTATPAELLSNVFGAPERFVTGASNYALEQKPGTQTRLGVETAAGPLAALDPQIRHQWARGLAAALHPNDPNVEAESERLTHIDKLLASNATLPTVDPSTKIAQAGVIPNLWDSRARGLMQNFLVRSLFQAAKDPLSYGSAGMAPLAERMLREAEVAQRAGIISKNKLARVSTRMFATNVPVKEAQAEHAVDRAQALGTFKNTKQAIRQGIDEDRQAIAAVNTARGVGASTMRRLSDADEQLVMKNLDAIKQVTGPQLERPQTAGEVMAVDTAGNARPNMPVWPKEIEDRLDQARPKLKDDRYLDPFRKKSVPDDPVSVLRAQLADSRELLRRQAVEKQLAENTKNMPEGQLRALAARTDPTKAMATREDVLKGLAASEDRDYGPSWARAFSDIQVDAMLATGAPHIRNVLVAALMSSPPQDVAKALYWAAFKKTPQAAKERLEHGAAPHFGSGLPRSDIARTLEEKSPVYRGVRRTTGAALDRVDEALRASKLQRLDKEMKGAQEFEKLDRVNQDLGEYNVKPQWATFLPLLGANFPQWHGYNVPLMFARAAMRRPGNLANIGRAERNVNDQLNPDAPYQWTLGGPAGEGSSAALDLARVFMAHKWPSYIGGQSTAGLLSLTPRILGKEPYLKLLAEEASGLLPFGSLASDAIFNQFPQSLNDYVAGGVSGLGFYPVKRTASDKRRLAAPQTEGTSSGDPFASVH